MKEITFIIPCAGKATRLGIPFCKEMLPINKDITLIDLVFNNLRQFKEKCQIVIIISKNKMDLVEYLSKYSDEFDIYFVYQKTEYKELVGAIKSAEEFISEKNILILPDIFIKDKSIESKLSDYVNYLDYNSASYLITEETNKEILSRVGNVKIDKKLNLISDIIDKPSIDKINELETSHYWISIGFTRGVYYENYFNTILSKKTTSSQGWVINSPYVTVDFALDLGVWDNIKEFYKLNRGDKIYEN